MDSQIDKDLTNILQPIYDKIFKNEISNDQIYYHYTNYKGLEGILKSNELRLSDFTCLNDPMELKYGHSIFSKIIKKFKFPYTYGYWRNFWGNLKRTFNNIFTHPQHPLFGHNDSNPIYRKYFASFSIYLDHSPLWRYYGNNAAGFSIGFRFPISSLPPETFLNIEDVEPIVPVYYSTDKHKQLIEELLEATFSFVFKQHNRFTCDERTSVVTIQTCLLCYLIDSVQVLKSSDWESEQEYRLIITRREKPDEKNLYRPSNNIQETSESPYLKQEEHPSKVSYKYQFNKTWIKEIYIGPRNDFQKAKEGIKQILQENNYPDNIKIIESKLSYRI